jgi:hypothetical protein
MIDSDPNDLCDVVKEITAALLEGDWSRYKGGNRYYYIIRERDHDAEIERGQVFSQTLGFHPEVEPFWDWYIRAALAEERPDRLAVARRAVVEAGVDPQAFHEGINACVAATSVEELQAAVDPWMRRFLENKQFDAFIAFLQALRIERVRHGHLFISEKDRPELRQALEARFLKELAERYPKAVKRATTFEWLSFSDPQLREASRCYVYGFFRAAVLIAVAAVETRLRSVCVADRWTSYSDLADLAFGPAGVGGTDKTHAAALKDLFDLRHRIAHLGAEASPGDAEQALLLVRSTLEKLPSAANESS